jgi:hypothetical protein
MGRELDRDSGTAVDLEGVSLLEWPLEDVECSVARTDQEGFCDRPVIGAAV